MASFECLYSWKKSVWDGDAAAANSVGDDEALEEAIWMIEAAPAALVIFISPEIKGHSAAHYHSGNSYQAGVQVLRGQRQRQTRVLRTGSLGWQLKGRIWIQVA